MPILTFVWMVASAELKEHYGASTVRFAILLQRTGLARDRVDRHVGRHRYLPKAPGARKLGQNFTHSWAHFHAHRGLSP
jgi:hypothetical protein